MKTKYKTLKNVTKFDRSNHLASINDEVKPIPLKYSKEVKLASKLRRDATAKRLDNQYKQFNYENSQNLSSARINKTKTSIPSTYISSLAKVVDTLTSQTGRLRSLLSRQVDSARPPS